MKTYVVGAGGVGGFLGALLARAGADLHFVARGEHAAAMREHGLQLKSIFAGDFLIAKPNVIESISEIKDAEVIFLAVKTYDLEKVASELAGAISDKTIVITLQNGIDADLIVKKHIASKHIYPGLVYIISNKTAPGVVEQIAGPCTFSFGTRDRKKLKELILLESLLIKSGIQARFSENIERDLWLKFIWITTFAGMTSLFRSNVGDVVRDKDAFDLYLKTLKQAVDVARAYKIDISEATVQKIIEKSEQYRFEGGEAKSSMLVDLELGQKTEIEALNGTLIRLGREKGVDVSLHEVIYGLVKFASA